MHSVLAFLQGQPLVLVFLALGLGTLLGRVRLGMVSLGSTAGTLVVALLISSLFYWGGGIRFALPGILSTIFLQLFMFAIGLRVGPSFFSSLKSSGLKFLALGLITALLNFLIVVGAARLLHFDPGFAAGIISGSYTITAVIGVASTALDTAAVHLPAGMTATAAKANITAGYALTYVASTLGIMLLVRSLPGLFGFEPVRAAAEAESRQGNGKDELPLPGTPGEFHLEYLPTDIRAYRVDNPALAGLSAQALGEQHRTAVVNIVRQGQALDLSANPALALGDEVAIFGTVADELAYARHIGAELAQSSARQVPMQQAELLVLNARAVGETLGQLRHIVAGTGLFIRGVFRQGLQLPLSADLALQKGDVLRVYGARAAIILAGKKLGGLITPSLVSDNVTIALGLVAGLLLGALTVHVGNIPFGLGASGGVMLAAMLIGWWRTHNPRFGGPVQEPARAFLQSIGLDLFIAALALNVAPDTIESFSKGGMVLAVFATGLVAALLPSLITWLVGLYLFKMDPIILAGAVAGARNSTPALSAIQEQSRSEVAAIGYPIPYALTSMLVLILGYMAMLL